MKIKIGEILVFKNPRAVDWEATDNEIREKVSTEYPEHRASENAMLVAKFQTDVRKLVKRIGVRNIYNRLNPQ